MITYELNDLHPRYLLRWFTLTLCCIPSSRSRERPPTKAETQEQILLIYYARCSKSITNIETRTSKHTQNNQAGSTADEKATEMQRRTQARNWKPETLRYDTIRYDTRCYFNVRPKANTSQLNPLHGTLLQTVSQ